MRIYRAVAALTIALVNPTLANATGCDPIGDYTITGYASHSHGSTPSASCGAFLAYAHTLDGDDRSVTSIVTTGTDGHGHITDFICHWQNDTTGGGESTSAGTGVLSCPGGGSPVDGFCECENACEEHGNQTVMAWTADQEVDGHLCTGGCSYDPRGMTMTSTVDGVDTSISDVEQNGDNCDFTSTTETLTLPDDDIATAADGTKIGKDLANCGIFNGEHVCLPGVPDGHCVTTEHGATVCATGAGTPPTPDNGTPGTPATPDATITNTDHDNGDEETTVDYYGPVKTGASSGQDPTGETPIGGDPTATGNCGAPGQPRCLTTGSNDNKTGTFHGAGGEAPTFGESIEEFQGRLSATDLVNGVTGIAGSIPEGGSCPAPEFELFGETYAFTQLCTFWDEYGPVLGTILLAAATIAGAFIILSA